MLKCAGTRKKAAVALAVVPDVRRRVPVRLINRMIKVYKTLRVNLNAGSLFCSFYAFFVDFYYVIMLKFNTMKCVRCLI